MSIKVFEMSYTNVLPVQAGYYWLRNYLFKHGTHWYAGNREDQIVRIDNDDKVWFIGSDGWFYSGHIDGEWSKRIEPPE